MRHGSLFSGIGGFDLAAEWMRWENIFHCEWNPFGQKILKYYWPNAKSYSDITKTDFTIHRGKIDVLTGGFPCQPYSVAGKRLGKEDDRHLWPEMLRAIREIWPRWVVGENVRGLINWSEGLVFHEIQAELEAEGYEVFPFLLPACGVNAPHRRDRIWFVAHANSDGYELREFREDRSTENQSESIKDQRERVRGDIRGIGTEGLQKPEQSKQQQPLFNAERNNTPINPDTTDIGLQGRCNTGKTGEKTKKRKQLFNGLCECTNWQNFPTESPICRGNDGISERLDGITFPKWRNESIKAYGNAIVPQVVFEIFKAIENTINANK